MNLAELLASPADAAPVLLSRFRRVNSRLEMLTDGRWQRYVPFRAVRELLGRPDRHAVETERRRLAKLRSRHRRPQVYRETSRRYEAAHKDRLRELRIARYWKNRPKMLAKLKAYRDKNRERFRADSLRRYYADRERRLVYMREYGKRRNPKVRRVHCEGDRP